MSVYLSVAPPDGFSKWGEIEWERWLKDHPWEAAERICSRADWAIFLYQVRLHAPRGSQGLTPIFEQLVNERPLSAQQAEDFRDALDRARDELDAKPAAAMRTGNNNFASTEDLESMIASAYARVGKDPSLGDVWGEVFDQIDKVVESAIQQKRGLYFGNV